MQPAPLLNCQCIFHEKGSSSMQNRMTSPEIESKSILQWHQDVKPHQSGYFGWE
jgi:hypothetical protein